MPAPERAGAVKSAWTQQLRSGFRQRGFRGGRDGQYARAFDQGDDNIIIRLRAGGRGESVVDLLMLGVGITVHEAERQAAQLRGGEVNPNETTLVTDLFDLAAAQHGSDVCASSRDFVITSNQQVPAASSRILDLVDEVAEPWLQQHHDLQYVLDMMLADRGSHHLGTIETLAVLAFQRGDHDACRGLLVEHEADLTRRGADLPVFAENHRWHAGLVGLLDGDQPAP